MHHLVKRILTHLKSRLGALTLGPIIAAVLLTLLLAANVAADTPPTTYYACVNIHSGSIRMVTASATCLSTETKISWNQVGPAGPQGQTGATGPQGPAGPAGGNQQLTVIFQDGDIFTAPPATSGSIPDAVEGIATCPAGSFAFFGDFFPQDPGATDVTVIFSKLVSVTTYAVQVVNGSTTDAFHFKVQVDCLELTNS